MPLLKNNKLADTLRNRRYQNKTISNNIKMLRDGVKDIYQHTYYSLPEEDYDDVKSGIEVSSENIRSILASDGDASANNISKLMDRLSPDSGGLDGAVDALDAFNNPLIQQDLLNVYANGVNIKQQEAEIDTICHYMPKLQEAIKTKKDLILSADHYSKDFLSYFTPSKSNIENFSSNMKRLEKNFELSTKFEQLVLDTCKYGEQFVYIIPYKKAFERLFGRKPTTIRTLSGVMEQCVNIAKNHHKVITESLTLEENQYRLEYNNTIDKDIIVNYSLNESEVIDALHSEANAFDTKSAYNLTLEFSDNYCIESVVANTTMSSYMHAKTTHVSLTESFINHLDETATKVLNEADRDFNLPNLFKNGNTTVISDSLPTDDKTKINVPGAIMKVLPRTNVLPVYLEDTCMCYLYFEIIGPNQYQKEYSNNATFTNTLIPTSSMGTSNRRVAADASGVSVTERDTVLGYISGTLAKLIDKKFVNTNQDLRKDIYTILKNNDMLNSTDNAITGNIRITCIPASEIVHMKYNTNPKTHRGVSDLAYSIFPATIWCWITMANALGMLTRGQDKRLYYLKTNIDTNVSAMMMNAINQIQRGNFGIRQMESINNLFGIVGKFNDVMMPLSPSGDQPLQVDVLRGQEINVNMEFLDKLEEIAIGMSDISIDFITAREQIEYAIQATMTNNKIARHTNNRQDITCKFFSQIVTALYNFEFDDNIEISAALPEPLFLKNNNDTQTISAIQQNAQTIAELVYPQDVINNDENKTKEKALFIQILTMKDLERHLSPSYIKDMQERAKLMSESNMPIQKQEE